MTKKDYFSPSTIEDYIMFFKRENALSEAARADKENPWITRIANAENLTPIWIGDVEFIANTYRQTNQMRTHGILADEDAKRFYVTYGLMHLDSLYIARANLREEMRSACVDMFDFKQVGWLWQKSQQLVILDHIIKSREWIAHAKKAEAEKAKKEEAERLRKIESGKNWASAYLPKPLQ